MPFSVKINARSTDMVEENTDGTFTDKETGESLERVIAKMSKS